MNNMKRMRGRNQRHGGSGGGGGGAPPPYRQSGGHQPMNRNHSFDSSGPDMRLRGTAQQLFEKYLQLGRDATGAGDRVMAESYFQHAEHYFRILNAMNQAQHQQGGPPQRRYQNGPDMGGGEGGEQDQQDYAGQMAGQNGQNGGHHANGHAMDGDEDEQPNFDPRDPPDRQV